MKCLLCNNAATHRKIETTGEVHFYCAAHAPTDAPLIRTPQSPLSPRWYVAIVSGIGILVIIGLTVGITRVDRSDQNPEPMVQVTTMNTSTQPAHEVPEVPLGVPGTANTLFSFIDTFTAQREMGTPQIVRIVPELDLLAFMYGTSQESTQFGVYNYTTNTLYKGIGANNYIESQRVVALLPNDQIVIWSSPGVDALAGARPKMLLVNYVTKEIVATITIPAKAPAYFHEAYNFNGSKNTGLLILKNTFDHTEKTVYETWELNLNTLTLKKVESFG